MTADNVLSILIVDDLKDNADSLTMALRLYGFDAHAVYSGSEAFDCGVEYPDVVILDLWMPGEDGWSLARRFANSPKPPLVISMTGSGWEEDQQRSEEAGISLHLLKPFDLLALVFTLRRIAKAIEAPKSLVVVA